MKHFDLLASAARPRAVTGFGLRADAADPKAMLAELKAAFEDFKKSNDEKLKAKADVVTDEKVERISAAVGEMQKAIDEANARIAAARLGAGDGTPVRDREYTDAFRAHFRSGAVQANLNKGADAEGGYLAPIEWDRSVTDKLVVVSSMRDIASVQSISGTSFRKLFNGHGAGSGWVGETAARPETATPTLGTLTYATGELYANPAATQQLLDDAEVDLEAWLAKEVELEFAYQEGIAFVAGNGTNKPNGLLTYATGAANAAAHPWGAVTLVTAASNATIASDELVTLVYAVPQAYSTDARFVMNRSTLALIRKLKDGDGNYLWQPSFVAGQPQTIMGYPVTEMAAMPNIAASAIPIAFGDFRRGYLVIDRIGLRVLRDPYTNKPFVHFYTTKRVGGGLLNPEPLKFLKMAA